MTESHSLDRSMAHAVAWSAAARWASQILSWASTIIVARLLTPYDYGIAGMAGLYLNLALLLSQAGISDAVIALRDLTQSQISELNTYALLAGLGLVGLTCGLASPIAHFFATPALVNVLLVSSGLYLFSAFQVVPRAILQKELRFKLLAGIETVRASCQIAATIVFALLQFRYWSLVIGYMVSAATVSLLTYYYARQPFSWPRFRRLQREITFSYRAMVGRIAAYAYDNADFAVAGKVLGSVPLGNYTVAWTISSAPVEKISNLLMGVTPAYFSTIQTDKPQLRRYVLRLTELLSLVTVPASIGLAVSAPYLVPAVLGPKWVLVIGPLRLLGLFVAVRSVATVLPNMLTAIGDAQFVMWASFASAIVMPIAFLAGSHWGTTGIAAAWAVAYPPMMVPFYVRAFRKTDMKLREYAMAVMPAASASAIMAIVVLVAYRFLPRSGPPLLNLALLVAAGAISYAAALFTLHYRRIAQLVSALKGMLRPAERVTSKVAAE
ncbi:MAG: lipopolysaccharide biosynthesis protein [Candidatus Acidiferrales bacterium]